MRYKRMIGLLLACGLLMSPMHGNAANEPKLVINTAAGATYEFFIADNPTMTYKDNVLVCRNDKGLEVSVEASEVRAFSFVPSNVDTGVNDVDFSSTFGSVLSGLKGGSKVTVSTLDGKVIHSLNASEAGTVEVDFNQLPHGVIVIKTEKGSLKIHH